MNKNDIKPETETETKTDVKPQVRIVDLEEVREILGAAAPSGGTGGVIAKPPVYDTTGCSW